MCVFVRMNVIHQMYNKFPYVNQCFSKKRTVSCSHLKLCIFELNQHINVTNSMTTIQSSIVFEWTKWTYGLFCLKRLEKKNKMDTKLRKIYMICKRGD